jgi:hypothetical protein
MAHDPDGNERQTRAQKDGDVSYFYAYVHKPVAASFEDALAGCRKKSNRASVDAVSEAQVQQRFADRPYTRSIQARGKTILFRFEPKSDSFVCHRAENPAIAVG